MSVARTSRRFLTDLVNVDGEADALLELVARRAEGKRLIGQRPFLLLALATDDEHRAMMPLHNFGLEVLPLEPRSGARDDVPVQVFLEVEGGDEAKVDRPRHSLRRVLVVKPDPPLERFSHWVCLVARAERHGDGSAEADGGLKCGTEAQGIGSSQHHEHAEREDEERGGDLHLRSNTGASFTHHSW